MMMPKFAAGQLGNPTGIFARFAGFLWNRRNAALNDTVFVLLALQPTDRVLDIGFGGGYLLSRMSGVVRGGLLAGVDVSPAMVAHAEKRYQKAVSAGQLDLRCAVAESLPYPDRYFSKVCSVNSIFYWQDVEQGIGEIKRVLYPEGKAVLCFTCKASMEKKGFAKNLHLFEAGEIERILTRNGFCDIETAFFSDRYRQYTCITAKGDAGA
jgi:arsenite methyltransferase